MSLGAFLHSVCVLGTGGNKAVVKCLECVCERECFIQADGLIFPLSNVVRDVVLKDVFLLISILNVFWYQE